ncbi:CHAT domain-containing protein, partial [Bacteroidota bacterium]
IVNNANELEKKLSSKSEQFAENYERKKITWRTIQAFLQPGEAAVEIIRFRYREKDWTDTIYYAALIITEQTIEHPDIIVLDNGKELETKYFYLYRNNIRSNIQDNESFNNYWSKIFEKMKDIKKVYLSPDGVYNKINPATFMKPEGKYLLEVQEIQILNSTKEIVTNFYKSPQETKMLNSAELFGNPKFETGKQNKLELAKNYLAKREYDEPFMSRDSLRGYRIIDLPGTAIEVENIENFLKSKSWVVNTYLGESSVKAAVKSVNDPRVLHIATHGFFLSDFADEQENMFGFESKRFVENPLLRSGLLFSGAGNFINDKVAISYDEDNGILSAYEAMNLDLDHTELVVLSACETGLGVIQNGEGVYGLQRAFQTAGAKTVLMSLWKVGDQPTKELMTMFYFNWVSGMTKREAFKEAQLELKKKYEDPYYWGAFVLVGE